MKTLESKNILLLDPGHESRGNLKAALEEAGASVAAADSATDAKSLWQSVTPNLIVTALSLPDAVGASVVAKVRAAYPALEIPTIGLVGSTERRGQEGFAKYLQRPIKAGNLVSAASSLLSLASGPARFDLPAKARRESSPALETTPFSLAEAMKARIEKRDVRGALVLLNASAGFRFTSMFRFDGQQLTSVWTFDRQNPDTDGFPLEVQVASSYCSFVRDTGRSFSVADASTDERVANHPKRLELLAYCGVPLRGPDGALAGTLCHFDLEAKLVSEKTVAWLEMGAGLLQSAI